MASLCEWRSYRIKQVCRSTIGAETMAYSAVADMVMFLRLLLAEMLIPGSQSEIDEALSHFFPVVCATSCRWLYDVLIKEGQLGSTIEKRLAVDLIIIRDLLEPLLSDDGDCTDIRQIVRWCPTLKQLADALTKQKPPHELREILARARLCLTDHV